MYYKEVYKRKEFSNPLEFLLHKCCLQLSYFLYYDYFSCLPNFLLQLKLTTVFVFICLDFYVLTSNSVSNFYISCVKLLIRYSNNLKVCVQF